MHHAPVNAYTLVRPLRALFLHRSELAVEDIPAGAVVRSTGHVILGELVEIRWGGAVFGVVYDDLAERSEFEPQQVNEGSPNDRG
jgi:hypothetical protein